MKRAALLACLVLGALAAPASAEVVERTYSVGPVTIGPYQVDQGYLLGPQPGAELGPGFVTSMSVDVTDADGTPIPINRIMLHH